MNIGKYINELLLENETVIIPGFGAFISNYKSAEINTDTNELQPPSKEISFNQQIRNNDGLLVGSVALGEGVSHFDALKLIEKERENIVYQLDKGEKVILAETGELSVNKQNEIKFISFIEENLSLDSFGLESVSLKDLLQNTEEENIVAIKNEFADEVKKEEPEPVLIPEPAVPETKPEQVSALNNSKETKQEEKKKRGWLWLLLTLIPIIFVGIFIIYQNSEGEKPAPKMIEKEVKVKEESVVVLDTVVQDSTTILSIDSTEVEEIRPAPLETPLVVSANFYLVGGSFKAEGNANNYMLELKERGFEPFHLGKRGNFFIVGIGAFQTEKEAVIAKRQFYEENPNSGVWIMEAK